MNETGALSICILNDLTHLLYMSNIHQRKFTIEYGVHIFNLRCFFIGELINLDNVVTLDRDGRTMTRPRRRFSLREGNRSQRM